MKTKKIADNPAVVSEGVAASAAAPKKAREPRAKSTATTHKHKKAQAAASEPLAVEAVAVAGVAESAGLTHEQIAVRAYLIAEARGFQGGSAAEDWFQAEHQLRAELLDRA